VAGFFDKKRQSLVIGRSEPLAWLGQGASFYLVNKMKKGWLIGLYWYACIVTGKCEEIVNFPYA